MTRPEYTGERDLTYSRWHRTISPKCYAYNIDYIEVRGNKIVALIEEKDARSKGLSDWEKSIFLQIADSLQVPFYIVFHNCQLNPVTKEKWKFKVQTVKTGLEKEYTEPEFRNFLETLR